MTLMVHVAHALRALNRRYKLLFALAAAWAPILLATNPLLACSVVSIASTLFFVSVSNRSTSPRSQQPLGTHDEEP